MSWSDDVPRADGAAGESWNGLGVPAEGIAELVSRADSAVEWLQGVGCGTRADLLDAIASAFDARARELVQAARVDTGMRERALEDDLARSIWQLRRVADVVRDGAFLDLRVYSGSGGPGGEGVRRMLRGLGPVAVFGVAHRPFSFGAFGGDVASAIGAGCSVLFSAGGGHTTTALAIHAIVREVIEGEGGPPGVHGVVAGSVGEEALARHAAVRAVGIADPLRGSRLHELVAKRAVPVRTVFPDKPLSPVVVTSQAVREAPAALAQRLATEVWHAAGRLALDPCVLLVPLQCEMSGMLRLLPQSLARGVREARASDMQCDPDAVLQRYQGSVAVAIAYSSREQRDEILSGQPAPGGTVFVAAHDNEAPDLVESIVTRTGRVAVNQLRPGAVPDAEAVLRPPLLAGAGPAPSTSVRAVRRWMRPAEFRGLRATQLPFELRDDQLTELPHRLDGMRRPLLRTASTSPSPESGAHP